MHVTASHPPDLSEPRTGYPTGYSADGGTLLALGIELHRVRGCLLENIAGVYRLAAWQTIPRLGERHLADQVAALCRQMGSRLGRRLWDDDAHRPLLHSSDPTRHPPIEQMAFVLSPRPPLRVWVAALSRGNSLEAARLAVGGSAAQLQGMTVLGVDGNAAALAQALGQHRPDLLLLVGGYDLPDAVSPVQALAGVAAAALQQQPRRGRPAVIFAGNRFAAAAVEQTLAAVEGLTVAVAPNVLAAPLRLYPGMVAAALDEHYWRLCRRLDGFGLLGEWTANPATITTPAASFTRLIQTWMRLHQLPELHGIYCAERWMHVWAEEGRPNPLVFLTDADPAQAAPPGWPQPILISGPWPERAPLPDRVRWWDRSGLAPVVAALGASAPVAMAQTLHHDLLAAPPAP